MAANIDLLVYVVKLREARANSDVRFREKRTLARPLPAQGMGQGDNQLQFG